MIVPRFTIRTALIGVTGCALVFVVVGMALRGETWAWGIAIAIVSLALTMLVHAAWFALVSLFARLTAQRGAALAMAPASRPAEAAPNSSENRDEAQP